MNVKHKVFKYGEYLTRQNEIPDSMIIIVSGICKTVLSRVDNNIFLDDERSKSRPKWCNSSANVNLNNFH